MKRNVIIVSSIAVFFAMIMVLTQSSIGQENNRRSKIRAIFPKKHDQVERGMNRFANRDAREIGAAQKLQFVLKQLDLSEEQINQIKELRGSVKDEIEDLIEARKALREAVTAPVTQENIIRERSQLLGDAIEKAAVEIASVRQSFRAILTEDQLSKVDTLREKIQERKDKRNESRQEFLDLLLSEDSGE